MGGSETSCPATAPVPPPPPAHWYANGHDFSISDGQQLGRGPEFYNNMAVSIFFPSLSRARLYRLY